LLLSAVIQGKNCVTFRIKSCAFPDISVFSRLVFENVVR